MASHDPLEIVVIWHTHIPKICILALNIEMIDFLTGWIMKLQLFLLFY